MGRAVLILGVLAAVLSPAPTLRDGFQKPPEDAKVMVRWWWFGPAVTRAELEREMKLMKAGGFGGFEVQPVYPLALDDPARGLVNLRYLSPEFLDAVRFTAATARKLGLRMDMTLGSGWPFGGPHISPAQAAGRLRLERVRIEAGATSLPLPPGKPGEQFVAAFAVDERLGSRRDLVLVDDGGPRLLTPPASGPRVGLVFFAGHTGQMVKRAAVGSEGYVHDHYDRAALETHLEAVGEKLAAAAGPGSIRAVFCDSLEVFGSDWTPRLLEEFQRRRGYDLRPWLPALVADIGEKTSAVRHDWGQTLTELLDEQFLAPLLEWCRRHDMLLRVQGYGVPPASLSSYSLVDLPEGEGAHWNAFSTSRWASSAAHNFGRPVASSETWTWIHSPVFRATPLDFKAEADQHFLEGITQLIGHGWPYSPTAVGKPGWRFYAAGVMNDHNPWWHVMPDLTAYLARVSFMLRQGEPVSDVALYAPTHDAWASFTAGRVSLSQAISERIGPRVIPRLLEAGYNFDLVDDDAITELGRVRNGRLVLGRHGFRIVVLPGVERLPAATLERLREFARGGGSVVATRRLPTAETGEIARLVKEENEELDRVLAAAHRPDVILTPPAPEIGFVHRSTGSGEVYFLANTGNARRSVKANFRVTGRRAEWWNAFSGEVTAAEILGQTKDGTEIALDLEPYGSRLLVFSEGAAAAVVKPRAVLLPALDLSRDWDVTFEEGARKVRMERLRSWTEEAATRFYSGRATYRKTVSVAAEYLLKGARLKLDFGEARPVTPGPARGFRTWLKAPVREAAEVLVNGQRAGSVWCPPYEIDVTKLLRAGENMFEVIVSNLAINRMAGEPPPDYKPLIAKYGDRFQPQDLENLKPLESGLVGAMRLVAY
ncbi:MAG: glycosyl hydrolase [Acidobacteriota bacterium]